MVHLATGSPPIGAGAGSERPEGHTHTEIYTCILLFKKTQTHNNLFYHILGNVFFLVVGLAVPTR